MPIPIEFREAVVQCITDVIEHGRHSSTALERLFRSTRPDAATASAMRRAVFAALRYNDMEGALRGVYDGVADPSKAAVPDVLRDLIRAAHGDYTDAVVASMLADADTFIRVNTLVTTIDACAAALHPFRPTVVGPDVLRIDAPYGLFATDAFASGWFEQQDVTSQRAGRELDARPGQRIIDACAGAGGKTLLFAAAMHNKGRIIALDTSAEKLDALRVRCTRAHVDIVDARPLTSTKVVKRLADSADGVFIDVPCTGTGVVRRNPDILRRFNERTYTELLTIQADILRRNALCAKPGGTVVYATCSVLPAEGRDQVHAFLAGEHGSAFRLENEWQTLPGDDGGDGFYVARLTRSSGA